jgi:hypothetical protein
MVLAVSPLPVTARPDGVVEERPVARPRTWTDDDLRVAVAEADTIAAVVRALRLRRGGGTYLTVRSAIERLELDTSHFHRATDTRARHTDRRSWTDQDLEVAVAGASSLNGVFAGLGLQVGGYQWLQVRARILRLGLSTVHWRSPLEQRPSVAALVREKLAAADLVAELDRFPTRAALLRAYGVPVTSAAYGALRMLLSERGVPPGNGSVVRTRRRRSLEELLVKGDRPADTSRLRRRLLEEGIFARRCSSCGGTTWLDAPVPLQLDHVDGDPTNNEIGNLRVLCPNCHAMTETWCGRNRGRPHARTPR